MVMHDKGGISQEHFPYLLEQFFLPGYGVFYGGKIQNFPKLYGEFIAMGKNARQSSLVDIVSATYNIPLQINLHIVIIGLSALRWQLRTKSMTPPQSVYLNVLEICFLPKFK